MRTSVIGAVCFLGGAAVLGGVAADTGALRPEIFISLPWGWSAHQAVVPVALMDGSTITPLGTDANSYTLTVAGSNHTLEVPSTISYGVYAFRILNSGGVTGFSTASGYKFSTGTTPSWSSANGKYDVLTCQVFDTSRLDCAMVPDVR